jgi:hypothetical protein
MVFSGETECALHAVNLAPEFTVIASVASAVARSGSRRRTKSMKGYQAPCHHFIHG